MARIYEYSATSVTGDSAMLQPLDAVSRKYVVRFWLSVIAIVSAAALFYVVSIKVELPKGSLSIAMLAAAAALLFLVIMQRSMIRLHLASPDEAKSDIRIGHMLEQMDDRFAIFTGVRANGVWLDHLIVGPTGVYAIKTAEIRVSENRPSSESMAEAGEAREAAEKLIRQLVPTAAPRVEFVICGPSGGLNKVLPSGNQGWIVPIERIASSLLRRSGQEGAITKDVNETGAFSSDTLQAAAIEHALATHWAIPTRKTREDYAPTKDTI